jgi:hypothetical protein
MDLLLHIDYNNAHYCEFDEVFSSNLFSKENIIDLINHGFYIIHILEDIF